MDGTLKNRQYFKFSAYGFLKNLRFFDAFLLLFFIDNEITFAQAGILYASREIITNVFEIPSGVIADMFGRKYALLFAFFLYILSFLVFYISNDFLPLLVAMLLIGIGDAFRSGTHKGIIMDYLRINNWSNHKIEYYGHTRSWSQRGSALSALMAGLMVFYSGDYRLIYLISVLPYLLNLVNIYTYPNELNFPLKQKSQLRKSLKQLLRDLFISIRKPKVFSIVNSAALHSAFLKSIKDYIQVILVSLAILLPILSNIEDKSKSGLVVGVIYFFIFLLTSFASQNAGKVASLKISKIEKKTLLLGIITGILCGVFVYFEYYYVAVILFILIYIVENLRKPILTGYLSNNVPDEILTSVISVQSFYQTFITALLSITMGVLADVYGVGIALITVSALLLTFSLITGNLRAKEY